MGQMLPALLIVIQLCLLSFSSPDVSAALPGIDTHTAEVTATHAAPVAADLSIPLFSQVSHATLWPLPPRTLSFVIPASLPSSQSRRLRALHTGLSPPPLA